MAAAVALRRMGLGFASLETERQKREAGEENEENGGIYLYNGKNMAHYTRQPTRRFSFYLLALTA
jgi:hypothetical protein